MIADPAQLELPAAERAIVGLTSLVNEVPWTLEPADFDRARAAGLSDDVVLHVVLQTAFFNHLNRVADGVGIEFDYETSLPPMARLEREPLPRPERSAWPRPRARPSLSLDRRPASAETFARWSEHNVDREAPLSRRDRSVIRGAVASALCDETTVAEVDGAIPRDEREQRLADYATLLTLAPWRVGAASLAPLRGLGLDDAALLDVIALGGFQNTASRIRLALAAS